MKHSPKKPRRFHVGVEWQNDSWDAHWYTGGINAGKVGGIPFSHDRDLSQKLQRFMKGQEVTA